LGDNGFEDLFMRNGARGDFYFVEEVAGFGHLIHRVWLESEDDLRGHCGLAEQHYFFSAVDKVGRCCSDIRIHGENERKAQRRGRA